VQRDRLSIPFFQHPARLVVLAVFVLVAIPTPYALIETTVAREPADPASLRGFFGTPQLFWPSWAGILHHSAKTLPVFALWTFLIVDQLRPRVDDAPEPDATAASPRSAPADLQSIARDGTLRTL
jgi:hypothetical protein